MTTHDLLKSAGFKRMLKQSVRAHAKAFCESLQQLSELKPRHKNPVKKKRILFKDRVWNVWKKLGPDATAEDIAKLMRADKFKVMVAMEKLEHELERPL